jgi:hypothetical protein
MERVGDRQGHMERYCSTGQRPQRAVASTEEEEEVAFYMFRTLFSSIIRSLRLYIQHQVYVRQVLWLLAKKQPQNLYDIYLMLYV